MGNITKMLIRRGSYVVAQWTLTLPDRHYVASILRPVWNRINRYTRRGLHFEVRG